MLSCKLEWTRVSLVAFSIAVCTLFCIFITHHTAHPALPSSLHAQMLTGVSSKPSAECLGEYADSRLYRGLQLLLSACAPMEA
jgi:hypothetical protein